MTATASAAITLDPKIKDVQSAKTEMVSFIKNPPKDPIDAVKKFGSMLGVGTVISTGLTAAFPFAAPLLPMLSGIFDLFSDAPSIGEMTLDAIHDLGNQISEGLKNLQEATENIVKEQSQRTIDIVLAAGETVAREQSALDVLDAMALQGILADTAKQKGEMYVDFLNDMQAYRQGALDDLTAEINAAQKAVNDKYSQLLNQVYGMIAELAPAMLSAMDAFLNQNLDAAAPAPGRSADSADAPVAQNLLLTTSEPAPGGGVSPLVIIGLAAAAGGVAFLASGKKRKKIDRI